MTSNASSPQPFAAAPEGGYPAPVTSSSATADGADQHPLLDFDSLLTVRSRIVSLLSRPHPRGRLARHRTKDLCKALRAASCLSAKMAPACKSGSPALEGGQQGGAATRPARFIDRGHLASDWSKASLRSVLKLLSSVQADDRSVWVLSS